MVHYIYRIDFLCGKPGRYYLGKRSFPGKNIENDSYAGSGDFCKIYYEKYGKINGKTYAKTIIEINESKEQNRLREIIVIGDLGKTDPLCMNQCPGGSCSCSETIMKQVVQYDLDGNIIDEYESITEASVATGADGSSISKCCQGSTHRKIVGGFIWRYKGDSFDKFITPKYKYLLASKCKKINQYEIDGTFIKTGSCQHEIYQFFGKSGYCSGLTKCLNHEKKYKTAYGYRGEFYKGNTDNIPPLMTYGKYPVKQYDLNNNFIKEYQSCCDAAKAVIGNRHGEKIKKCAEGLIESAHGYKGKFVEN